MSQESSRLPAKARQKGQDALIVALAAGKTIKEAARLAGIHERTARKRLARFPEYATRIAALRADMISKAVGKMADSMGAAADTLRKLLSGVGESARLGPARSIIELGNKLRESVELEERLQALEQRAHNEGKKP
jgi:hypothetical protein